MATTPPWDQALRQELLWPPGQTLARGARGPLVRRLQEWLLLAGERLTLDGEFGPGTERAVRGRQAMQGLALTGVADEALWQALTASPRALLQPAALPPGATLGQAVAQAARRFAEAGAREVGGKNAGPWVRLFMGGHDGPQWLWCAGFASTSVLAGAAALGVAPPFPLSYGCDELARAARAAGRLVRGEDAPGVVAPGDLLLLRGKVPGDWHHVAVVLEARETLTTAEGNTNAAGSREGTLAAVRTRRYRGADFARLR